jgi:asparagine synthase (glutamine-hydrolysing)
MLDARALLCPEPLLPISYTHPFLHRPLVEFMMSIPSAAVCRPGEPRRLMRRALAGIVSPTVLRRRSKGTYDGQFLTALRPLAQALAGRVGEMRLVELGYVDPEHLLHRLGRLVAGLECNEPQLRNLMLLELWLRRRTSPAGQKIRPATA